MTGSTSKCKARVYGDTKMCSCGLAWENGEDDPHFKTYYKEAMKPKPEKNLTAMIGFLAAKLACYEPNNSTVQEAINYLEGEI